MVHNNARAAGLVGGFGGGLFPICELDAMGYVDQASGRAVAVVNAEDNLGALMCGPCPIEDAGVQLTDEGRISELAGNVRAGLGAVSEDIQDLAAIVQANAGDQCKVRIAFIALHHQCGCATGESGELARLGLGVHKPGKVFSRGIWRGPEILFGE
jgi:hypothetical protein